MYLLLIYFLILVVPVAVMPRYIKSGSASPYRIVLYGTIGTAAAIVIVLSLIHIYSCRGVIFSPAMISW